MSYRYRIFPSFDQTAMFNRHCSDARFVWNLALEQFNFYRPSLGPTPNNRVRSLQLADARKMSWLGDGSSSVQQAALRDFDRAVWDWRSGRHGRPTWRKKHENEGFCVRDVRVHVLNRKWAEVSVPKCGRVRFRLSRPMPAKYGMGRVTLDRQGRWHVSFNSPQTAVEREETGRSVGIDLGVTVTVATSDGEMLHCPTPSKGERARRARLQRRMARQRMGSNRRERTRVAIAKLTGKQADRRKDWVEKVSTDLVRRYDTVVFEDLKVRNMMRPAKGTVDCPGTNVAQKRGLNRSISEQGWSMLVRRTTDKAEASGVTVAKAPAAGTSQTCSRCSHRSPGNRASQSRFACVACGHTANADFNAAVNICAAGLAVLGRGGADISRAVEPSTPERTSA